jgi:hypothetical protein
MHFRLERKEKKLHLLILTQKRMRNNKNKYHIILLELTFPNTIKKKKRIKYTLLFS